MKATRTKQQLDFARREGVLAAVVRNSPSPLDPQSLARSYNLPLERVRQIITRNGGSIG